MIGIFDKEKSEYLKDDDGEVLAFKTVEAAKNYLFDCDFTYEFVKTNFEFKTISDDKSYLRYL